MEKTKTWLIGAVLAGSLVSAAEVRAQTFGGPTFPTYPQFGGAAWNLFRTMGYRPMVVYPGTPQMPQHTWRPPVIRSRRPVPRTYQRVPAVRRNSDSTSTYTVATEELGPGFVNTYVFNGRLNASQYINRGRSPLARSYVSSVHVNTTGTMARRNGPGYYTRLQQPDFGRPLYNTGVTVLPQPAR